LSGQPQVAVVDGPAGAGKQRLVDQFARRVRDAGATVAAQRVLQPLDHSAVERLLHDALGETPDTALVTAIIEGSGGLPGRVLELAKGLAEREVADRVERAIVGAEEARGSLQPAMVAPPPVVSPSGMDHRVSPSPRRSPAA
jgi:predicted ATPase